MNTFDPQTSLHIDVGTGQITYGGAARNRRIAEAGGLDQVQKKAFSKGYLAGHADGYKDGFEEGCAYGAQKAYNQVEERLRRIENALLQLSK